LAGYIGTTLYTNARSEWVDSICRKKEGTVKYKVLTGHRVEDLKQKEKKKVTKEKTQRKRE
jgi:hypothetical protein